MCCINHLPHVFSLQESLQPRASSEAANPCGQGLRDGSGRPSGIGKHRVRPALCQGARQLRGLAGAAKQKDARHV